jgi:hypothetical protein
MMKVFVYGKRFILSDLQNLSPVFIGVFENVPFYWKKICSKSLILDFRPRIWPGNKLCIPNMSMLLVPLLSLSMLGYELFKWPAYVSEKILASVPANSFGCSCSQQALSSIIVSWWNLIEEHQSTCAARCPSITTDLIAYYTVWFPFGGNSGPRFFYKDKVSNAMAKSARTLVARADLSKATCQFRLYPCILTCIFWYCKIQSTIKHKALLILGTCRGTVTVRHNANNLSNY